MTIHPMTPVDAAWSHMDGSVNLATLMLFDIFGRGPETLQDLSNRWFGSNCSLVLINVAGPRETRYLASVPTDRMMA